MRLAPLALALAACGSSSRPAPPDLAVPLDFAVAGQPDLSPTCAPSGTNKQKFVVDSLTLPQSSNDFAYDLNGDGHADNRLGNILGAFAMNGQDSQPATTQSITSGANVILLTERSNDPQFLSDACATTVEQQGAAHTPGTPITVNGSVAPGNFAGAIAAGKFDSTPSVSGPDVTMTLFLPILTTGLVSLPLHGAHIRYTFAGGGVMAGQLNGAILAADVRMTLIPTLAAGLTQQVQSDMGATTESLFDTGGTDDSSGCKTVTACPGNNPPPGSAACKNPPFGPRPNLCADQCDFIIDTCEVSTNALIKNLLAPDVQLFQGGVYAPSSSNMAKDSLSIGIGFTATSASF